MKVKDLIKQLQQIKDKTLDVRVIEDNEGIDNFWLDGIEVNDKGDSGYEMHGEVRLIGKE